MCVCVCVCACACVCAFSSSPSPSSSLSPSISLSIAMSVCPCQPFPDWLACRETLLSQTSPLTARIAANKKRNLLFPQVKIYAFLAPLSCSRPPHQIAPYSPSTSQDHHSHAYTNTRLLPRSATIILHSKECRTKSTKS